MTDFRRFEWIRDKVACGLGVEPQLVDELYEDQAAQAFILQFLDGGEPGHSRRIALGLTLGFVLGARLPTPSWH